MKSYTLRRNVSYKAVVRLMPLFVLIAHDDGNIILG
jgi:hypothetical protein